MSWQSLSAEKWIVYSHAGLVLVDDFTAKPPKYPVSTDLEYQDGAGNWHSRKRSPVATPSGIISYTALGRSAQAAAQAVLRHRVLLRSSFYRPEYLRNSDGIEFDVHPYDDTTPPAVIPSQPQTILMLPNTNYSYPTHVRVISGLVQDNTGSPVADVEVSEGARERVLTDERGAFSLPLRWSALTATVLLDALDYRTGRSDSITINLPGDLSQSHLFTIT